MPTNDEPMVPDAPSGEPSPEWIDSEAVLALINNIVGGWWATHPDDVLRYRMEEEDLCNAIWKRLYDRKVWRTWNPHKNDSWRAYLIDTIKREIGNERRRYTGNASHRTLSAEARRIYVAKDAFAQEHHREPTIDELSELTTLAPERIVHLMQANDMYRAESLTGISGADPDGPDGDSLNVASPFGQRIQTPEEEVVADLSWLPDSDRTLLRRKEFDGENVESIAADLGVDRATVYRRLKAIKQRIREYAAEG